MNKKWIAMVLAALMLLTLGACAKNPGIEKSTEPVLSLGTRTDNRYENPFIGIGCELSEDWTFLSDQELRQQNQIAEDLAGDEYAQALKEADVLYGMMASNSNQMDTVVVHLEKLSGVGAAMTEESYVEKSMDSLEESLQSMGVENLQTNADAMDFAGKSHSYVTVEGECIGMQVYVTIVCVRQGDYMACVTVTTWQENSTMQVLDCFYGI